MLLEGYTKEIFRSRCNSGARSLHCYAHLEQDVSGVIAYLNAELGGDAFTRVPPSVTFKAHGKLITVHPRLIAINALSDECEAEMICRWLQREINDIWDRRQDIEPRYAARGKPGIFEILKRLPSSCACAGGCGQPTCTVLAVLIAEGAKSPEDCPHMDARRLETLREYLSGFEAEI